MSDYISEKIDQYERKLKQAEKAGKHNKAKKYAEKLERLRAEAAEQDTDSDTDSDDDIDSVELRAAILGYGPNSGDDSGRVVVQPRAIATRTRSL